MAHTLIALAFISLLELLIWLPTIWTHFRKPMASVVIIALSITSGWLVGYYFSVLSVLILIGSAYRIINLLRLVEGRSPLVHMSTNTWRTSLILIDFQAIVVILSYIVRNNYMLSASWLDMFRLLDIVIVVLLLATTLRHLRETRATLSSKHYSEKELPSITVAIPARNETDDLKACLDSLISSSYPKLEILVLDDCSQNKRTPLIIKDFAQSGVRFTAGKAPPNSWLAKNYAYQQLADEASGEIILFCGVDTRFQPTTLGEIIDTFLEQNLTMLSIMPVNKVPKKLSLAQLIIQPARYAWELAVPREWLNRPPVLSTCWLIKRGFIRKNGGFKAVKNSTSVESYFALAARDGYNFLRGGHAYGLKSQKALVDQRATAIRTRYPQTHRRPEIVGTLSLLELLIFIAPYGLLVNGIVEHSWLRVSFGLVNIAALGIFYAAVVSATYEELLPSSLWILPFSAIYDICVLNYSMWRYEFAEVIWKGRNVCIPLMQQYGDQSPPS